MKKMTLVENALLDRLREKQVAHAMTQPELTSMLQIQNQIEETLKTSNLSEEDKVNILQRAQQRFGEIKESIQPRALQAAPDPEIQQSSLLELGQIPKQNERKVKKFEEFLTAHPGIIEKNEENEVRIDGELIPGSNYSHLLRNIYVHKGNQNLTGNASFINALKKVNLPASLVSNPKFKSELVGDGPPKHEAPPPTPEPPKHVRVHMPILHRKNKTRPYSPTPIQSGERHRPPGKRPRILRLYR